MSAGMSAVASADVPAIILHVLPFLLGDSNKTDWQNNNFIKSQYGCVSWVLQPNLTSLIQTGNRVRSSQFSWQV